MITQKLINSAYSYDEYRRFIEKLISEGKTSGPNQDKSLVDYTKLNFARMSRIDKTTMVNKDIKNEVSFLKNKWIWFVLTEAWCGDAANINPVIAKIAGADSNVELKFILRDENHDIMDRYLTNGTRSIPLLICIDAISLEEVGKWGPRPANLQKEVNEFKNKPGFNLDELKKFIQMWYFEDKTQTIQKEFLENIKKWKNEKNNSSI